MPVLMRNRYQNENMGSDYFTRKSLSDPNAFNEETSGMFPEKLHGASDGRKNTVPFPLTREGKSKVKAVEELLGKPTQQQAELEQKKAELETERQQAITEATKPVVELELLGDENEAMDLILDKAKGDKDGGRAKVRQHERIRAKFQALKELIDCV